MVDFFLRSGICILTFITDMPSSSRYEDYSHAPTQNRMCAINTYGFSLYIFTLLVKQTHFDIRP